MTRRDYIAISKVLHDSRQVLADHPSATGARLLVTIVNDLVSVLEADNASFDRVRFVDAIWPNHSQLGVNAQGGTDLGPVPHGSTLDAS